jgi:hypothetical protein
MLMQTTTAPPAPSPTTGKGPISARAAVELNEASGRAWSIYLEEVGRLVDDRPPEYRLVMPAEDGVLTDDVLRRRTGVVVSWPTNPHNTGEAGILDRLNAADAQASFRAPVTHPRFRADQDGRHWRTH